MVFGNLLENAAEAAERIKESGEDTEKRIRLSAVMHMDNLVIHMENSIPENPENGAASMFPANGKKSE